MTGKQRRICPQCREKEKRMKLTWTITDEVAKLTLKGLN